MLETWAGDDCKAYSDLISTKLYQVVLASTLQDHLPHNFTSSTVTDLLGIAFQLLFHSRNRYGGLLGSSEPDTSRGPFGISKHLHEPSPALP